MSNICLPKVFKVAPIGDTNGMLHYFEVSKEVGLLVRRVFWIHEVPSGGVRGEHAHLQENQLLVCLQGKVTIELEALSGEMFIFHLSEPNQVLYLPAQTWSVVKFQKTGILLGISDRDFSEADYLRDKYDFEKLQQAYRNEYGIFARGN
jgi:hypothetical protein